VPIYIVGDQHGVERLVQAKTKNGALAFVAHSSFQVHTASIAEVVEFMQRGVKVENEVGAV
jgi:hypothetical protein